MAAAVMLSLFSARADMQGVRSSTVVLPQFGTGLMSANRGVTMNWSNTCVWTIHSATAQHWCGSRQTYCSSRGRVRSSRVNGNAGSGLLRRGLRRSGIARILIALGSDVGVVQQFRHVIPSLAVAGEPLFNLAVGIFALAGIIRTQPRVQGAQPFHGFAGDRFRHRWVSKSGKSAELSGVKGLAS